VIMSEQRDENGSQSTDANQAIQFTHRTSSLDDSSTHS